MAGSRIPDNDAEAAEVERKADTVLKAIFFHFNKNKLSMDGSILVLAAAYAMVISQAADDKQKKDLETLFEKMVARTKKGKIILPGEN